MLFQSVDAEVNDGRNALRNCKYKVNFTLSIKYVLIKEKDHYKASPD